MGQLRLKQMIDALFNRYLLTYPNESTNSNIQKILNILTQGDKVGITYNKKRYGYYPIGGTPIQGTSDYTNSTIFDEEFDITSSNRHVFSKTEVEAVQNLNFLKMHMDAVKNQNDCFTGQTSVRVYYGSGSSDYSTMNLNLFREAYAEWLMFDFDLFSETIRNNSKHSFLGAYDTQGEFIINEHCIALRFLNELDALNIPLIPGPQGDLNATTNSGSSSRIFFNTVFQHTLQSQGQINTENHNLFSEIIYFYSGAMNQVDLMTSTLQQLQGTNFYKITNTSGSTLFYIFKKELIDELMVDLYDITGLNISYSGNIDSPTPAGEVLPTEPGQEENDKQNQGGTGDLTSTQQSNPAVSVGTHGLTGTCYVMNYRGILQTMGELWNPDFLEMVKSLTTNAQGAIINSILFPFDINISGRTPKSKVYLGNFSFDVDSERGASVYDLTAANTININCGTLSNFKPFFNGFLDANPYTQAKIWLPYLGYKDIDPDFIYNKDLSVNYLVDLSTGKAKAQIWTKDHREPGEEQATSFLVNEYEGQIGIPISLSSSNFGQMQMTAALNAVKLGASIATGTASLGEGLSEGLGIATAEIGDMNVSAGSSSSSLERMTPQNVFILFIRQKTYVPDLYNQRKGRPSLIKAKLSETRMKGFTTVDNPKIETNALPSERDEINNLLTTGIYIK